MPKLKPTPTLTPNTLALARLLGLRYGKAPRSTSTGGSRIFLGGVMGSHSPVLMQIPEMRAMVMVMVMVIVKVTGGGGALRDSGGARFKCTADPSTLWASGTG